MNIRIGHGYDVHQLVTERPLIIGGVNIPWSKGLAGHSDADVLLHAICDACLGAAGLGDIGRHFSDKDPAFKNIDSRVLLKQVAQMLSQAGYEVVNVDATILAQQPKMAPHITMMEANISQDLAIAQNQVNVKATTTESLGFVGREEGIASHAVVLIKSR